MAIGNISSANAYLAQSYRTAQGDMATALARLGTNQRFQTVSQDSDAYGAVVGLRGSIGVYDASLASANSVKGEMEAFDGWATTMLEQLGELKAAAGDTEKVAAIEGVIADLLTAEYNGAAIADGDTATTITGVDGATTTLSVATIAPTGTEATVDADIALIQGFADNVREELTRAEATAAAASAMASTSRGAIETIFEIDAAEEAARYTAADIRQQSAAAVISQGNMAQRSQLLLLR